jgi:hypothetical protein
MNMGEKIKDNLTGEVFEVKKIVKERKLLRDETSHRQCLTGRIYKVGMIKKEWVALESEDGLN